MNKKIVFVIALFLLFSCASKKTKDFESESVGYNKLFINGQEYLPIIKVAPIYPRRAAERGIAGHCTIEYIVTDTGRTKEHKVVTCSHKLFIEPSVDATKKFIYKPYVLNGSAVDVPGVQNMFLFELL